jgi:hypothetical protein
MTTEVTEKSHRGTEEAKANAMMGVPPLGFLVFPLCIPAFDSGSATGKPIWISRDAKLRK